MFPDKFLRWLKAFKVPARDACPPPRFKVWDPRYQFLTKRKTPHCAPELFSLCDEKDGLEHNIREQLGGSLSPVKPDEKPPVTVGITFIFNPLACRTGQGAHLCLRHRGAE